MNFAFQKKEKAETLKAYFFANLIEHNDNDFHAGKKVMQSSYEHFVPSRHVQRQDQFNWNLI